MKRVFAFLSRHYCRLALSLALVLIGSHWGGLGMVFGFIVFLLWEDVNF